MKHRKQNLTKPTLRQLLMRTKTIERKRNPRVLKDFIISYQKYV